MEKSLFVENEILINSTLEEVWDTLVNPEKTKIYMYTCEVICDWKIEDEMLWKGSQDGVIYVKGYLEEFEPLRKMKYSVIDPNGKYPDVPENYLHVTYTLQPMDDGILLSVSQGDYSSVQEGESRYKDTVKDGGWQPVLEAIKDLVEGSNPE